MNQILNVDRDVIKASDSQHIHWLLAIMSTIPTETSSDENTALSALFHSYMLNTLFLGIFDLLLAKFTFTDYILHLTGFYTSFYFGTMYIYSETLPL